jgi:hypothetical protein
VEDQAPSTLKVARCAQMIIPAQRAAFLNQERGKIF